MKVHPYRELACDPAPTSGCAWRAAVVHVVGNVSEVPITDLASTPTLQLLRLRFSCDVKRSSRNASSAYTVIATPAQAITWRDVDNQAGTSQAKLCSPYGKRTKPPKAAAAPRVIATGIPGNPSMLCALVLSIRSSTLG